MQFKKLEELLSLIDVHKDTAKIELFEMYMQCLNREGIALQQIRYPTDLTGIFDRLLMGLDLSIEKTPSGLVYSDLAMVTTSNWKGASPQSVAVCSIAGYYIARAKRITQEQGE